MVQRRRQSLQQKNLLHRDWVEYEDGFGSLTAEFWYGLRALHCLTSQGDWEMRIDFQLSNGTRSYMHYGGHFRVGPAEDDYQLSISDFKGITPEDPFGVGSKSYYDLNLMKFTTRDNDLWIGGNCGVNGHSQGRPQGGGGGQLGHFAPGPQEGPPEYLFKRSIYSNRTVRSKYSNRAVTVFFRGAV